MRAHIFLVYMLCIIETFSNGEAIFEDVLWASSEEVLTEMDKDSNNYSYSAVKIDVSEVSHNCVSKVLVLSRESTANDVVTTLLKKLKMRDYGSSNFVIEAELVTSKEIAILQFEDDDKPMHAYEQFPKGALSFFLRPRIDMDSSSKSKRDAESAPKANLNGHQLTIQRIRRSLEKLKRKSSNASITSSSSTGNLSDRFQQQKSREQKQHNSVSRIPQGMMSSVAHPPPASVTTRTKPVVLNEGNHLIKADELYKEPMREHRGRQGRSRRHHSDSQPPSGSVETTARSMYSPSRSESMHLYKTPLNSNNDYTAKSSPYKAKSAVATTSPYKASSMNNYKTSLLPQGGTVVSMDNNNDCMIFYDSSDTGSIHSMPVPLSHQHHHNSAAAAARSHVIPQSHQNYQHSHHKSDYNIPSKQQGVMIDKPQKSAFRNLEDSGIDVKSPPHLNYNGHSNGLNGDSRPNSGSGGSHGQKVHQSNSCDNSINEQVKHSNNASQESNPSYLSPTVSDPSPFSLLNGLDNVKRSGSFSSMKSLPVSVYKDNNSTPNSFLFEPIEKDNLRSKSQSCTNLNSNKVVRRRSLPPLDVSQEKLEQKKSSLSKRLARKINRYRENEKRYVLPSPHSFTPKSLQNYKEQVQRSKSESDDMSFADMADMEVANILEGKPEHPTDSDVEEYLACVESTDDSRTGYESRDGDNTSQASHSYPEKKSKYSSSSSSNKVTNDTSKPSHSSNKDNHKAVDMEKSGYHRYSNSAKLEKQKLLEQQQQQQRQSNDSSKSSHTSPYNSNNANISRSSSFHSTTKEEYAKSPPNQGQSHNNNNSSTNSGQKPKKKSLNKFVEQSMQSFLDHCHDVNMVDKHDSLDLHQAALHGQFPPNSPVKHKVIPNSHHETDKIKRDTTAINIPHADDQNSATTNDIHPHHHNAAAAMLQSHKSKSSPNKSPKSINHHHQGSSLAKTMHNDSHFTYDDQTHVRETTVHSPPSPMKAKYDFATVYFKQQNEEKVVNRLSHSDLSTGNEHPSQKKSNKYSLSNERGDGAKTSDTSLINNNNKMEFSAQSHVLNNGKPTQNGSINDIITTTAGLDYIDGANNNKDESIQRHEMYKYSEPTALITDNKKDNTIIDSDSNSTTSSSHHKQVQRRSSQCSSASTVNSQSSKDKYQNTFDNEDDAHGKTISLFTIIRSHKVFAVFLEKGSSYKSFGIKVKREVFSPSHNQAWVGEPINGVVYNVVVINEVLANSPADMSGSVANGDVIIEVNGHSVLQSSDKVVRTLLDARSTLEVVVARERQNTQPSTDVTNNNNQQQQPENTQPLYRSQQVLTFHNMEDIKTDDITNSTDVDDISKYSIHDNNHGAKYLSTSSRSKAYETIYGEELTSSILSQRSEEFDDIGRQPTSPPGPTFLL